MLIKTRVQRQRDSSTIVEFLKDQIEMLETTKIDPIAYLTLQLRIEERKLAQLKAK